MISFQHMINDNDDDVIVHAVRGGRGGRRTSSRRRWGFAAAGVGAAAGGVLLARNKRVRKLVRRGLKTKAGRSVLRGINKSRRSVRRGASGVKSYLKNTGAFKAVASKASQYSASIKGSKLYGSVARLKSAVGSAYKRVKRSASGYRKRAAIATRRVTGRRRSPATRITSRVSSGGARRVNRRR